MNRITSKSPTHEKLTALIEVQAAINALKLVHERGLGTTGISEAVNDLRVFERQLQDLITNHL